MKSHLARRKHVDLEDALATTKSSIHFGFPREDCDGVLIGRVLAAAAGMQVLYRSAAIFRRQLAWK